MDFEKISNYSNDILSGNKNIFEINDPNIVGEMNKVKDNFRIEEFYNVFDGIRKANNFVENIKLFFDIINDLSQVGYLQPPTQTRVKNELSNQFGEKTKRMVKSTGYYKMATENERVLLLISVDIITELSKEKVNI